MNLNIEIEEVQKEYDNLVRTTSNLQDLNKEFSSFINSLPDFWSDPTYNNFDKSAAKMYGYLTRRIELFKLFETFLKSNIIAGYEDNEKNNIAITKEFANNISKELVDKLDNGSTYSELDELFK